MSDREYRRHVPFLAAAAALLGSFVFFHYLRAAEPFGLDQGLFACFGRWIPEGRLPYRDLWDSKPPAVFYTYALAHVLFGEGPGGVWRLELVWLAATAVSAFLLARRAWGKWAGLAAAAFLLAGTWAPGWGGYWARAQAEEFAGLWLLLSAWAALSAKDRALPALGCGVAAGIAGLYKVPALALAAAWPMFWVAALGLAAWRRVALLAAGIALPWVLALGYFASRGALGSFLDATLSYSRVYAGVIGESSTWLGTLRHGFTEMFTSASVLLVCALAGIAHLARRRPAEAWWLGPWIVLALASVLVQRQLAGYHFLVVVPGLALAAGYGSTALLRGLRRGGTTRALCAVTLALVVVLGAWRAPAWRKMYGWSWAHRLGDVDRVTYLSSFRVGSFSPAIEDAVARYVRRTTGEGDAILVWSLSPGIYALSGRRPATRYPFHHLLLTESPLSVRYGDLASRRAEFLERLRQDPPELILVGTNDRNPFEPLPSDAQLRRFVELRELARRGYRQEEAPVGGFIVLRRSGS